MLDTPSSASFTNLATEARIETMTMEAMSQQRALISNLQSQL